MGVSAFGLGVDQVAFHGGEMRPTEVTATPDAMEPEAAEVPIAITVPEVENGVSVLTFMVWMTAPAGRMPTKTGDGLLKLTVALISDSIPAILVALDMVAPCWGIQGPKPPDCQDDQTPGVPNIARQSVNPVS